MSIKVITSDMDGTFLDDKGSYDKERFNHILDVMNARDMYFVVASGNSMSRLKPIFVETFYHSNFVAKTVIRRLVITSFCVRSLWDLMILKIY